jgi:hypothetical protein
MSEFYFEKSKGTFPILAALRIMRFWQREDVYGTSLHTPNRENHSMEIVFKILKKN